MTQRMRSKRSQHNENIIIINGTWVLNKMRKLWRLAERKAENLSEKEITRHHSPVVERISLETVKTSKGKKGGTPPPPKKGNN